MIPAFLLTILSTVRRINQVFRNVPINRTSFKRRLYFICGLPTLGPRFSRNSRRARIDIPNCDGRISFVHGMTQWFISHGRKRLGERGYLRDYRRHRELRMYRPLSRYYTPYWPGSWLQQPYSTCEVCEWIFRTCSIMPSCDLRAKDIFSFANFTWPKNFYVSPTLLLGPYRVCRFL